MPSKEAGRWAQLEAREKELKVQLREAAAIKLGWEKMKKELKVQCACRVWWSGDTTVD